MKRKLPVIILCALMALVCAFSLSACVEIEFKVNFIVDGVVYDTVSTNGNENIQMPDDPTKDGFTFEGWYLDKDVWEQPFTSESLANETLTLNLKVYAKWKSNTPDDNDNPSGGDTPSGDDNPQTHIHAFPLEHHEAKNATCSEDGNVEYWQCSECKKYYSDEEATTEITLADTVIAAHHTLTHVEAKGETCTEDGNVEYWQCSGCKKYYSDKDATTEIDNIVIKASHKYGTWIQEVAATCTENGTKGHYHCDGCGKNYDALYDEIDDFTIVAGHKYSEKWSSDETYHWHTCENKGCSSVSDKAEHSFADNACSICNAKKQSEEYSEGLEYTLNSDGESYSVSGIGTCADAVLVIPSTYNDKPVTSIGDDAFA